MSLETVITTIANQLAKQRSRAMDGDGGCAYRGHSGSMCAVGALIPEELYSPVLEGSQVDTMLCTRQYASTPKSEEETAVEALLDFLPSLAPELDSGTFFVVLGAFQDFHDNDNSYLPIRVGAHDEPSLLQLLDNSNGTTESELAQVIHGRLTEIAQRVISNLQGVDIGTGQ